MNEKQKISDDLNMKFHMWRRINSWIDRFLLSVLLFLILFTGSGLVDGLAFLEEGITGVEYHSFARLLEINPDTSAWLTVDGTHIDHPVVRSRDNFDYLDRGFDGRDYAGGTLFMDKDNKSFEDPYSIIHGHNMAAGAMFGDLDKFLDRKFFGRNSGGTLLTPDYDYDLEIFASGVFDAYDRNIYKTGGDAPVEYIREKALFCRDSEDTDHVLALSTCLDDMTDNRAVVFCRLTNKRKHR